MNRRKALTALSAILLSASLDRLAAAKPGGNGNGKGHGGDQGGDHGGGHGGGKGPGALNGVVTQLTLDPTSSALTSFQMHLHGHGPQGYDVTVTVSSSTVFANEDGSAAQASDVKVGTEVQVRGSLDAAQQTVTASRVLIKAPENDGGGETHGAEVEGTVASVSTTGFVVHPEAHHGMTGADVSVATTGTTLFKTKGGAAATASDITVGSQVEVKGSIDAGTGALVATLVMIEPAGD